LLPFRVRLLYAIPLPILLPFSSRFAAVVAVPRGILRTRLYLLPPGGLLNLTCVTGSAVTTYRLLTSFLPTFYRFHTQLVVGCCWLLQFTVHIWLRYTPHGWRLRSCRIYHAFGYICPRTRTHVARNFAPVTHWYYIASHYLFYISPAAVLVLPALPRDLYTTPSAVPFWLFRYLSTGRYLWFEHLSHTRTCTAYYHLTACDRYHTPLRAPSCRPFTTCRDGLRCCGMRLCALMRTSRLRASAPLRARAHARGIPSLF